MRFRYEVRLTHSAAQDFENLIDWLASEGHEAPEDLVTLLENRCRLNLAFTPRMGRQLGTISAEKTQFELRQILIGHHRIVYLRPIDGADVVTILRLLHTAQDLGPVIDALTQEFGSINQEG